MRTISICIVLCLAMVLDRRLWAIGVVAQLPRVWYFSEGHAFIEAELWHLHFDENGNHSISLKPSGCECLDNLLVADLSEADQVYLRAVSSYATGIYKLSQSNFEQADKVLNELCSQAKLRRGLTCGFSDHFIETVFARPGGGEIQPAFDRIVINNAQYRIAETDFSTDVPGIRSMTVVGSGGGLFRITPRELLAASSPFGPVRLVPSWVEAQSYTPKPYPTNGAMLVSRRAPPVSEKEQGVRVVPSVRGELWTDQATIDAYQNLESAQRDWFLSKELERPLAIRRLIRTGNDLCDTRLYDEAQDAYSQAERLIRKPSEGQLEIWINKALTELQLANEQSEGDLWRARLRKVSGLLAKVQKHSSERLESPSNDNKLKFKVLISEMDRIAEAASSANILSFDISPIFSLVASGPRSVEGGQYRYLRLAVASRRMKAWIDSILAIKDPNDFDANNGHISAIANAKVTDPLKNLLVSNRQIDYIGPIARFLQKLDTGNVQDLAVKDMANRSNDRMLKGIELARVRPAEDFESSHFEKALLEFENAEHLSLGQPTVTFPAWELQARTKAKLASILTRNLNAQSQPQSEKQPSENFMGIVIEAKTQFSNALQTVDKLRKAMETLPIIEEHYLNDTSFIKRMDQRVCQSLAKMTTPTQLKVPLKVRLRKIAQQEMSACSALMTSWEHHKERTVVEIVSRTPAIPEITAWKKDIFETPISKLESGLKEIKKMEEFGRNAVTCSEYASEFVDIKSPVETKIASAKSIELRIDRVFELQKEVDGLLQKYEDQFAVFYLNEGEFFNSVYYTARAENRKHRLAASTDESRSPSDRQPNEAVP